MFDDLAAYFYENVVSSFEEYLEIKDSDTAGRSRDIRTAMIAASALFHLREHLPLSHALSRATVEHQCSDYGVLGDIVNASKHSSISNNTPHGAPLVTSATQLEELIVLTEYKDQDGIYHFVEKRGIVKPANGTSRNILEILTNVMNFWQAYLHSLGIVSKPHTYTLDSHQQPKARTECGETGRLNLLMVKGLRFHLAMLWQRYNYETGTIEPIDLTGSKVEMNIYRPRYEVDLSLTHKATGSKFKKTITLSEEESEILAGLHTDSERQNYVHSLPCAQEALQQLAAEAGLTSRPHQVAEKEDEHAT
jgi:hypothetical protein